jgi:GNAT superfamily N-acetyltransferase
MIANSHTQHSYEAARLHLADIVDADQLSRFFNDVEPSAEESATSMEQWLEYGGALVVENSEGDIVSALRWRESGEGWQLDHIVTDSNYRNMGYGRWLLTKVEALAIQRNVAMLRVLLPEDQHYLEPYYLRMGYTREGDGTHVTLAKQVGGMWQYH